MNCLIRYNNDKPTSKIGRDHGYRAALVCMVVLLGSGARAANLPTVEFEKLPGRLVISIGGKPFSTYVYRDEEIPRPYWSNVRAPNGDSVTRKHPPGDDKYADHPTMHPGIWMSFGDISGVDFWRNKARTRHVRFMQEPVSGPRIGTFQVENSYETFEDELVCGETAIYTIRVGLAVKLQLPFRADQFVDHGPFFATGRPQREDARAVRFLEPLFGVEQREELSLSQFSQVTDFIENLLRAFLGGLIQIVDSNEDLLRSFLETIEHLALSCPVQAEQQLRDGHFLVALRALDRQFGRVKLHAVFQVGNIKLVFTRF